MNQPTHRFAIQELGDAYDIAFKEWAESDDSTLWDVTLMDGLDPDDCSGFDDVEAGLEDVDVAEDGQ